MNVIFQDGYKIQDGEYVSDTNIPISDTPNLKRFWEGDYNCVVMNHTRYQRNTMCLKVHQTQKK